MVERMPSLTVEGVQECAQSASRLVIAAETLGAKYCNATLWKTNASPQCRAIMMGLDAMDIIVRKIDVTQPNNYEMFPFLASMENPLDTVPVFKDRKLILTESHVILTYLATRYAADRGRRWLPLGYGARALIEEQLHFDSGILYPRFCAAAYPILYENRRCVAPEHQNDIQYAYDDLDNMLSGTKWFGGTRPMLGDIAIVATVSSLNILVPIDKEKYPSLRAWLDRISKELFYISGNHAGLTDLKTNIGELTPVTNI